jgi:hypothetical protein
MNKQINEQTNEWIKAQTNKYNEQTQKQWMNKWMNEPNKQTINQSINQKIHSLIDMNQIIMVASKSIVRLTGNQHLFFITYFKYRLLHWSPLTFILHLIHVL